MAEIRINEGKAKDTLNRLDSLVSTELMDGILKRYKALESAFTTSCGDAAESIIENIKKEEMTLSSIACLMLKLNTYISDSAESFDLLDRDYGNVFKAELRDKPLKPRISVNANDKNKSDLFEYSYSEENIAVPMKSMYLSKLFCLAFALKVINNEGNHITCNGMGPERIAAELYAHALGYYSASALEQIGLDEQWIKDIKQCGSVADIGLGDDMDAAYAIIWNAF